MMPSSFGDGSSGRGNINETAVAARLEQSWGRLSSPLQRAYQLQQLQRQITAERGPSPNPLMYSSAATNSGINTVASPSPALHSRYLEQRLENPALMQGRILLGSNVTPSLTSASASFNQGLLTSHMSSWATDESRLLLILQQQQQQQQDLTGLSGGASSLAALAAFQQQAKLNQQYNTLLGASSAISPVKNANLGGAIEPFPEKLHRLLTEVEVSGRSDVISWADNGKAFVIHKPDRFFRDIVPHYFRQSRLSSFKRQL
jgi:hypothetical protein